MDVRARAIDDEGPTTAADRGQADRAAISAENDGSGMAPPSAPAGEPTHDAGLEGRMIPDVELQALDAHRRLQTRRAADIFGRGTTVLFTLPGADTPDCSNAFVRRVQQLAGELRSHGVDRIVCLSVDEPLGTVDRVRDEQAEAIRFILDAEGRFTAELGMLAERGGSETGKRSRRYSALVRDGAIVKAFVEPQTGGDPFTVSDADTMLRHLDPATTTLRAAAVLARRGCPLCARARDMLAEHGFRCEEIDLDERVTLQAVRAISGRSTVPQVFIEGEHIGGADELADWLERDEARRQGALEAPSG